MEAINYQGQQIQAEQMAELGGYMGRLLGRARYGEDELWRDEAGGYYLRQRRYTATDTGPQYMHEAEEAGVLFDRVHRINVNAAILWCINTQGSDAFDLRCDAAALLMEGRGYHDPHPVHPTPQPREPAGTVSVHLRDNPPSAQRFTCIYPPTDRVCGRRLVIELSDKQMSRAGELAAIFGLPVHEFLHGLANRNNLPGQARRSDDKLRESLQAAHLAFLCMDAGMARRIERAAQARQQTVDEFVAESLGSDVDMWEESMLLHPTTGELLEAEYESLYTEVEDKCTAPPLGCEDHPEFRQHVGRQRVRFHAYLTPEQLERLEFPHLVSDCTADEEVPTLLVPFDAEACPHLEVDGQRIQIGQTLPPSLPPAAEAAGMVVRLDAEASALVRRYLSVTPFDYSGADIVNGSLDNALGMAFNGLEHELHHVVPDGSGFQAGAWGYLEENIFRAQQRRTDTSTDAAQPAEPTKEAA